METEQNERVRDKRRKHVLPTICFLLLALLFLIGAVRLLLFLLPKPPAPDAVQAIPFIHDTVRPHRSPRPEPVNEVLSVITPPPETPGAVTPTPAGTATATQNESTSVRRKAKSAFSGERIDILIVAQKENGTPDCVAAASIRQEQCTVLFLPINTRSDDFGLLCESNTTPHTVQAIESVLPVDFSRYITVGMSSAADCIDALGGIQLAGKLYNGKEVTRMLEGSDSDELLRINLQQKLIDAFLVQLKDAGLLRFASLKAALTGRVGSNLTANQFLRLYQAFRRIEPSEIDYRILPVDSENVDGIRCYRPDEPRIDALVEALYG